MNYLAIYYLKVNTISINFMKVWVENQNHEFCAITLRQSVIQLQFDYKFSTEAV